jgi:hypothetical protein
MTLIAGLVLFIGSLAVFAFSLPRHGKTAKFVGTEWEGYAVVAMLCTFGLGLLFVISGVTELLKDAS